MRHAGAIHLGVDIPREPGFIVDVLNQRERVIGLGAGGMVAEYFFCRVAIEQAFEGGGINAAAFVIPQDGTCCENKPPTLSMASA